MKALRHEACDDAKFSKTITNIHKKLIEIENQKYFPPKISECISDLTTFCIRNYSVRSNSNDSETHRTFNPEKSFTSKTPNLSFLDRIIEETPKLQRSNRRNIAQKKHSRRVDTSNHPYYESMMSNYLKISLKSPLRNSATTAKNKKQSNQVQLTDGMFFRLF